MRGSAEEVLSCLIELLEASLEELGGLEANPFFLGEKYAYVECLEMVQTWNEAKTRGLDYNIERRFPLDRI